MAAVSNDSTLGSAHLDLPLGNAVRYETLHSSSVGRRERHHLVVKALDTGGLLASQVALPTLGAHDLAGARDLEAALGSLVGLKLGQVTTPWPWHPWLARE